MMKPRHLLAAAALGLGIAAAPAQAATVTTGWEELRGNQDYCLETGAEASRISGFRTTISNDRQTVFGWRGEDSIAIRCIGSRNVAVIFIYVQNRNDGGELMQGVRNVYRRPAGGVGGKG